MTARKPSDVTAPFTPPAPRLIIINDATKRLTFWKALPKQVAMVAVLFGPGLAFDNAPMQWAGFVLTCVIAVFLVAGWSRKNRSVTISEARQILDAIEGRT